MGSGETQPSTGFQPILRHALTIVVHDPQAILSRSVSLLGGQPIPLRRFGTILARSLTHVVQVTDVELCLCISMSSSDAQLPDVLVFRAGISVDHGFHHPLNPWSLARQAALSLAGLTEYPETAPTPIFVSEAAGLAACGEPEIVRGVARKTGPYIPGAAFFQDLAYPGIRDFR